MCRILLKQEKPRKSFAVGVHNRIASCSKNNFDIQYLTKFAIHLMAILFSY